MLNKTALKHIYANFIDLSIPGFSVAYAYFHDRSLVFEYISFFGFWGIVYLTYQIIVLFAKKSSVGYGVAGMNLISIKNGKVSVLKNMLRTVLIAGFFFAIGDIKDINYSMLVVFLLSIIPIRVNYNNATVYSLLHRLLGLSQEYQK